MYLISVKLKFDYGTQLSPCPIVLSIGTLKKPKLSEIADTKSGMGFDKFNYFEILLKMSPKFFYTKIKGDDGIKYWDSLTEEQQESISLYQVIINDEKLLKDYIEIFNFFFIEPVIFKEGYFIILQEGTDIESDISAEQIIGVISEKLFTQVIYSIQQICCIDDKEKTTKEIKYKNKLAMKLYQRMLKAQNEEAKKSDINLTIPNIISSVSNKHPTISPINVWNLTVFQLLDAFNRMQLNSVFDIDSTRVSVWGDEKKTFNIALWYKNEYDKN